MSYFSVIDKFYKISIILSCAIQENTIQKNAIQENAIPEKPPLMPIFLDSAARTNIALCTAKHIKTILLEHLIMAEQYGNARLVITPFILKMLKT